MNNKITYKMIKRGRERNKTYFESWEHGLWA